MIAGASDGGLGTGCMFIRRRVLEDARLRLAPDYNGIPCVFRATYNADDSIAYSDDLHFCLRARRLGSGADRIYTVVSQATDLAGNTATATATCAVPHDRSKK